MSSDGPLRSSRFQDVLEVALRIGLLLLLLLWCFQIVRPFLVPIVWGAILAIAAGPAYRRASAALGGRSTLAAVLFVLLLLAVFIAPVVSVSGTLIESLQHVATLFRNGELKIPPPPESVAGWPLVGERVSAFWSLSASNLEAALESMSPQLEVLGAWLLATAANLGLGILQFVFSVIIAGVLLANGARSQAGIEKLMRRLIGPSGGPLLELSVSTVRSVATGIVGVALIQATLTSVVLVLADIPGAGFLALLVLFLCIMQLGPGLILLPAAVYVFSTADTAPAVLFLLASLLIIPLDNVLKPLLLGRGVDAPMLVIFVGAIGGFVSMGIIGLFVGAVLFVLFYTLLRSWIDEPPADIQATP